jgi:hypothetical protein
VRSSLLIAGDESVASSAAASTRASFYIENDDSITSGKDNTDTTSDIHPLDGSSDDENADDAVGETDAQDCTSIAEGHGVSNDSDRDDDDDTVQGDDELQDPADVPDS